jgi:hypothetical protein
MRNTRSLDRNETPSASDLSPWGRQALLVRARQAGDAIMVFTNQVTFETYRCDSQMRAAVEGKLYLMSIFLDRAFQDADVLRRYLTSTLEIFAVQAQIDGRHDLRDEDVWRCVKESVPGFLRESRNLIL